MIIPQTELVQIPLQVLLTNVVVNTVHATLETGEKPFCCVRVGVANDITAEVECVQPLVGCGENSWTETYIGNGQWDVALDSTVWGQYGWKVFELSRSIGAEPISSDAEVRARRLSAIGCH